MSKYVAIRVSNLRGDQKIPFNAYVRVAGKYILFCREGDSFEGQRLQRLKSKKLQKMFVQEEQAKVFNTYLRENLERAYDNSKNKPVDIRTQIIQGAVQATAEDLMEDPASRALYKVTVDGAKKFAQFFYSEPNALKALLDIQNVDFSIAHHGVIVSALALAIAEEIKFIEERPMQVEPLAIGCMLHDIEHNFNNINFATSHEKLSLPEKVIYMTHAPAGAARIKNEQFYDPLIVDIVKYHDDKPDGSGPNKLKEKDTDLAIQIAAVSNNFDHYLLYENLSPKDALKKMLIEKMGVLSLECMKALQSSLKKRGII